MKICLDPGHGGNTGAAANGLREDELALDFALRIGHHLRLRGAETVMTRSGPGFVSLSSRGALAVKNNCDLFLSVHLNAAGSKSARGCEVFAASGDRRSFALAAKLAAAVSSCGIPSRGAKYDTQTAVKSLRVLRDTHGKMPAMLLEAGFLTSKEDAALLGDKFFRERVSVKIAETILGNRD